MTIRRLHECAREHLNSARQRSGTSVFGDHYAQKHPDKVPRINFTVVKQRNDLRLHIEEALAIKKQRPTLNRRQEDLGTGFFCHDHLSTTRVKFTGGELWNVCSHVLNSPVHNSHIVNSPVYNSLSSHSNSPETHI